MKLSALGKELKDSNHHSPQAWCALGNAYSLRNENDQAIKCFQRAIQLDDRFAYAHTLSGHEYKGLDEYDKALTEYRTALSIDDRHYPAWYFYYIVLSERRSVKCDGITRAKMGKNVTNEL